MRKPVLIGMAALAALAAACTKGSATETGPTVERGYPVSLFQRVEVAGPYRVEVRAGPAVRVTASGPEKLLENTVVEVKGDKLLIRPRRQDGFNWGLGSHRGASFTIIVPSLIGADVAGSGSIRVDKAAGDSFEGAVGGSGDLELGSVDVRSLKLSIGGSGNVRAQSGRAGRADYAVGGSGNIDAGGVSAQTATVSIAGSGSIDGRATGTAGIDIVGSGDVKMTGGARCTISRTGSGDARCS